MQWWHVDSEQLTIGHDLLQYGYANDYLHNGSGYAIRNFVDARTGEDTAWGFDGQYRQGWDETPVEFVNVTPSDAYVDIEIRTGLTHKIDRLYRDPPVLEIIYQRNDAEWTEDFIRAHGDESDITFVMYGMADVVGLPAGKALWDASEARCGHNYGDCFIAVNGSTPEQCTYNGHFIYGFLNRQTGYGTGFVYPTWITVKEWKVWWTETHKIEIEYAPNGKTGKRWIYAVTGGRDELFDMGKRLVDNDGLATSLANDLTTKQ